MWISSVNIKNYRLFPTSGFEVENINVPNETNDGSGLTIFVGENGCGKTSLLEAISLPFLEYKTDSFSIHDLNNIENKTDIKLISDTEFEVNKVVPRANFKAKGISFDGGIRSKNIKSHLSSMIVGYRRFLPSDQENITTNDPNLRINVDNPYLGSRFKQNDILFLDKSRTYQIRLGTYNKTRLDRLMEDFNFQYVRSLENEVEDVSSKLTDFFQDKVENEFLQKTIEKFKEISDISISLELIDNHLPFKNAFLGKKEETNLQIKIDKLGSGYEMIFSLLCSFYLAEQSGKQLIVLLDEPELHLHPRLQKSFVEILLELSRTSQIILTTQSPLLVKQLSFNKYIKINILQKNESGVTMSLPGNNVLPTPSANEVNYIAFNLATSEYHNELYGHLQEISGYNILANFDNYLQSQKNINKMKTYINDNRQTSNITLCTYIRHQIHHPDNIQNNHYTEPELEESIKLLRSCF